jgi:hypothetical protein
LFKASYAKSQGFDNKPQNARTTESLGLDVSQVNAKNKEHTNSRRKLREFFSSSKRLEEVEMGNEITPSTRLKVEYRKVADLIPYARNARTHSDEQVSRIAGSIQEFGWTNPILVDGTNGILAGHGRLAAARKLGMSEVPVIELAGLSKTQKRAYILADNKLALDAGWDDELLKVELEELKLEGVELDDIGFSSEELDDLLTVDDSDDSDEPDIPEPKPDPVSKRGDVWTLGVHRVMCGDSCSATDISKLVGGG